MRITREQYESDLSQLASRAELSGLKLDANELRKRVEEISKRCREDGDLFSSNLVNHDDRLKMLEKRVRESRQSLR